MKANNTFGLQETGSIYSGGRKSLHEGMVPNSSHCHINKNMRMKQNSVPKELPLKCKALGKHNLTHMGKDAATANIWKMKFGFQQQTDKHK